MPPSLSQPFAEFCIYYNTQQMILISTRLHEYLASHRRQTRESRNLWEMCSASWAWNVSLAAWGISLTTLSAVTPRSRDNQTTKKGISWMSDSQWRLSHTLQLPLLLSRSSFPKKGIPCKICLKSPCTASTALLALMQGLLRQILCQNSNDIFSAVYSFSFYHDRVFPLGERRNAKTVLSDWDCIIQ